MKHTVYSISQGDKTYLSFLSQALGLMADLDLGTEALRWMGDGRFIVGYLRGGEAHVHVISVVANKRLVVTKKLCPVDIEYKLVNSDKVQMAKSARDNVKNTHFYPEGQEEHADGLPWLNSVSDASSSEGWTKFDHPVMYL
jgi:sphingosine kinase